MKLGKEEISLIRDILLDNVSPDAVYLFGSYVNGSVRQDSDLDLAYLSEKNLVITNGLALHNNWQIG